MGQGSIRDELEGVGQNWNEKMPETKESRGEHGGERTEGTGKEKKKM